MLLLKKIEQRLRALLKGWRGKPVEPRFKRPQNRFRERYPLYQIGLGSYGMPVLHDWNEGSTLQIGNYCSIASNVQIFLGGLHRTDWVSSYPFPRISA